MKKSRTVLDWDEVETKKQKKGLIDAVLSEIALLRKSRALKDLLDKKYECGSVEDAGVILAERNTGGGGDYGPDPDTYKLKMFTNGEIIEYSSLSSVDSDPLSKSKLLEMIEEYEITPKDVRAIRKRIER